MYVNAVVIGKGWLTQELFPGRPRSIQSGISALHKMRSGGQQTVRVVHQHVNVSDGAQAVVAGEMNTGQPTGGRARGRKGGS